MASACASACSAFSKRATIEMPNASSRSASMVAAAPSTAARASSGSIGPIARVGSATAHMNSGPRFPRAMGPSPPSGAGPRSPQLATIAATAMAASRERRRARWRSRADRRIGEGAPQYSGYRTSGGWV